MVIHWLLNIITCRSKFFITIQEPLKKLIFSNFKHMLKIKVIITMRRFSDAKRKSFLKWKRTRERDGVMKLRFWRGNFNWKSFRLCCLQARCGFQHRKDGEILEHRLFGGGRMEWAPCGATPLSPAAEALLAPRRSSHQSTPRNCWWVLIYSTFHLLRL